MQSPGERVVSDNCGAKIDNVLVHFFAEMVE